MRLDSDVAADTLHDGVHCVTGVELTRHIDTSCTAGGLSGAIALLTGRPTVTETVDCQTSGGDHHKGHHFVMPSLSELEGYSEESRDRNLATLNEL